MSEHVDRKFERRMALFDAVGRGEMKPHEAEAAASAEGLEPLRNVPRLDAFDPTGEPWWTLPMALAWIVWRTVDRVRGQWDRYRLEAPYWFYREINAPARDGPGTVRERGYHLTQQEPAGAMDLALLEAFDLLTEEDRSAALSTVHDAREEFWRKASLGKFEVIAISLVENCVVEIPAREWPYLELIQDKDVDVLRFAHEPLSARYGKLLVSSQKVQKIWTAQRASAVARRDARRSCLAWLTGEMNASPDVRTMSKSDIRKHAKKQFGLGEDLADEIRVEAIRATGASAWSAAGPTKKIEGE